MKFYKFKIFTKEASPNTNVIHSNIVENKGSSKILVVDYFNIESGKPLDRKPKLPDLEVVPILKYLPDIFGSTVLNGVYTMICSNQFFEDLMLFKCSKHSRFDINVFFKKELFQFNYLHFPFPSNEMIFLLFRNSRYT